MSNSNTSICGTGVLELVTRSRVTPAGSDSGQALAELLERGAE